MKYIVPSFRTALVAFLAIAILSLANCSRKAPTGFASRVTGQNSANRSEEQFTQAIKMLNRVDNNDSSQSIKQILYRLKSWMKHQEKSKQWSLEPLHAQLPSHLKRVSGATGLSPLHFDRYDFYFLRESVWMRDIAKSLVARKTSSASGSSLPTRAPWLEKVEESRGVEVANKLQIAQWLFDWTVRNIQLEELSTFKKSDEKKNAPSKWFAWEALLLGRGNELLRARIFILLARQQGIDVVMLGRNTNQDSEPQPWLPAVVLGNQLFLFDMSLGLPIPGPGGQGIATLEEVRADETLLRALDLDDQHRYRLGPGDIKGVVAMIDATPAALSQRMTIVEKHLTGENKMVLTTAPGILAQQLRSAKGISSVMLWLFPYETFSFYDLLYQDSQAAMSQQRPLLIFKSLSPMMQGRQLHFRGQFEKQEDALGAINYYLQCRTSNRQIESIESSQDFQKLLLVNRQRLSPEEARKKALKDSTELLITIKQNASYWLGLIKQENSQYDTAIDYFQNRTLEASPNGPWAAGARYNLARIHESRGDFEKARELYRADQSPQRHGNLLRARRLELTKLDKENPELP